MTDECAGKTVVSYRDVCKNYGSTRVLNNVSLDFRAGRVHAIVGENGAGKSTFLGIASGRVVPTAGTVTVGEVPLPVGKPRAVRELGIHTIYQELTIVPALPPQANLYLGSERSTAGWMQSRKMMQSYVELCERLAVPVHRVSRSGDLSVADQQMLEIMRAVIGEARVLLFDEPTASLAHEERESLFKLIRDLKHKGIAIALVSHNLDEVLENSDDVSVFRDGNLIQSKPSGEWTKQELIDEMLGSATGPLSVEAVVAADHSSRRRRGQDPEDSESRQPVLRVKDLESNSAHGINFDLRPGEILGIAGLVGSGRTSLLRALAGLNPFAQGILELNGVVRDVPRSARAARKMGIALLPEDRKGQGLVLGMSSYDNITIGEWDVATSYGFLSNRKLRKAAVQASIPVGFDPKRVGAPARNLSGGNQQKLMLARWIHAEHSILLADEPTRGVDIGAKNQILRALEEIVSERRSMIIVSSELEEVVALSDRVLIISEGRQLGLLDSSVEEITVDRLLRIILEG